MDREWNNPKFSFLFQNDVNINFLINLIYGLNNIKLAHFIYIYKFFLLVA